MCFGRGVGERGAIAFTTGMLKMMMKDASVPSQFWIKREDGATVVGHEYGHFLRKHVTVNTLMMIGTMAISSLMDGVAQAAADLVEPLHELLKEKFPALKNVIDMILGSRSRSSLLRLAQPVDAIGSAVCRTRL